MAYPLFLRILIKNELLNPNVVKAISKVFSDNLFLSPNIDLYYLFRALASYESAFCHAF